MAGQRFGRLVVISDMGRFPKGRHIKCLCDCGKEKIVTLTNLVRQHTSSCGCYRNEDIAKRSTYDLADVCSNKVYYSCTRRCRKNGWAIDLTKADVKELVFASHCFYCRRTREESGTIWYRKDQILRREIARLGIDRVDSKLGYLKSNCVPCCFDCNSVKLDRSKQTMLAVLPGMLARFQEDYATVDEHW